MPGKTKRRRLRMASSGRAYDWGTMKGQLNPAVLGHSTNPSNHKSSTTSLNTELQSPPTLVVRVLDEQLPLLRS